MNIKQVRVCLGIGAAMAVAPMAVATTGAVVTAFIGGVVVTAALVSKLPIKSLNSGGMSQ